MSEPEKVELLSISNGGGGGVEDWNTKQARIKFSEKIKKLATFSLKKPRSKQHQQGRNNIVHPVRRSSFPVSASCAAMSYGIERVGCYMCLRQPRAMDSPVGVRSTGDPNSPKFSYQRSRALIEKNDFYDVECNTHIDISSS